jgi:hypothetical protein
MSTLVQLGSWKLLRYDDIGNLVKDIDGKIDAITWNPYNKISSNSRRAIKSYYRFSI